MRNKILNVLMLVVSVAPVSVFALGLGELKLHSYLSQPMKAEVELVGVQPGDAEVIEARLASAETHRKAGIDRPFSLSELKFSIQERPGGQPYVLITTRNAVKEPVFYFLLELSSPDGRVLREYTLLLDPPAGPVAPQVAAAQVEVPRVVRGTPAQALKMPAPTAAVAGQYGPTEIGDTLWEIALQVRPEGVSVNQAMLAIVRQNPEAFVSGNINQMLAGKVLTFPDADAYQQLNTDAARDEFTRQQQAWKEYKQTAPQIAPPLVIADTGEGQVDRGAEVAKPADTPEATAGRVRLLGNQEGSGGTGQADAFSPNRGSAGDISGHIQLLEESLDVRERENKGLRQQISDLENQLTTLKEMLDVAGQTPTSEAVVAGQLLAEESSGEAEVETPEETTAEETTASEQAQQAEAADAAIQQPGASQESAEAAQESVGEQAVDGGGLAEVVAPDAEVAPIAAEEPTEQRHERPRPKPVTTTTESGWLDMLMGNLVYLAGLVLIVALVIVGFAVRGGQKKKVPASADLGLDDEDETLVRTPAEASASATEDASPDKAFTDTISIQPEEETDSFLDDFAAPSIGAVAEAELEDVDPIAEADVFITYGHHEQAEEIILDAIQYDERLDLKLKLLDIYFGQQKAQEYEEYAVEIRPLIDDSQTWPRVAALGHSLNPDSELFSDATLDAAEVGSLVESSSVEDELDLGGELDEGESAQLEGVVDSFDLDDFAEEVDGVESEEQDDEPSAIGGSELSTSIDLGDYSAEDAEQESETGGLVEETVSAVEDESVEIEFDMNPSSADDTAGSGVASSEDDDESTVNFDALDFDDEQTAASEGTTEMSSDDSETDDAVLEFDTGDNLQAVPEAEVQPVTDEVELDGDAVIEFDIGESDGDDSSADATLDFDAVELDSADIDAELTIDIEAELGGGLDETVISFGVDDDEESDPETVQNLDAVASQLDLLAAYVDMGDSDQATALNEKIQAHGDDLQRQQANELISKLAG